MNSDRDTACPPGWRKMKLRDVCQLINGRAYKQSELLEKGKYTVLRVGNFFTNDHWYYSDLELEQKKYCHDGDLLYAWSASFGPRIWSGGKVIFHYHIWKVLPDPSLIDQKFLFMFLLWDKELIKEDQGTGTTMIHVSKGSMEDRDIQIPLLPVQHRIVNKLEQLFRRSHTASDELSRVPELVERYKRAILEAAFTGELTADWRTARDLIHKGAKDELICSRIACNTGKTKPAAAPGWKPEIVLPLSWTWASVDQISTLIQYGSSAKTTEAEDNGVPVLRMGNISNGKLDYKNLKFLPKNHQEFPDLLLKDGDVLFNRTNSAELVGKTAVYRDAGQLTSFASYLIRVRVTGYVPELLSAYLNSPFGKEWVRSVVNQQVGQANVNGTKLRELAVPLMTMEEQKQIWSRVNKAFAMIERIAAEAARAMQLLERLDRAALSKAFQGKLVSESQGAV
jgi:type I restriction enzyme, S subunit